MINHYAFMMRDKTPPYAVFQAQDADTIITLYESGKAMFQGISADIDANIWKQREAFLHPELVKEEPVVKKEVTKTGDVCPKCGHDMVIRTSKYGEFEACSNYPKCKYIKGQENKKPKTVDNSYCSIC